MPQPSAHRVHLQQSTKEGVEVLHRTGQVGLAVGSWPSNRATEGSNPKGTRLYFVILLKNEEKIFDCH